MVKPVFQPSIGKDCLILMRDRGSDEGSAMIYGDTSCKLDVTRTTKASRCAVEQVSKVSRPSLHVSPYTSPDTVRAMAGGVQVSHRVALRVGHRAVFGHMERRGRACGSIQHTVVTYFRILWAGERHAVVSRCGRGWAWATYG